MIYTVEEIHERSNPYSLLFHREEEQSRILYVIFMVYGNFGLTLIFCTCEQCLTGNMMPTSHKLRAPD